MQPRSARACCEQHAFLFEKAKAFDKDRSYTEREVNIIIADINDDFCTIRKNMVAEGLFTRDKGSYILA